MKQNQKIFIRLLVLFSMLAILLSPVQPVRAADCQSNTPTGGNWSVASSWTNCGGVVPTSTDNVFIQSTHTITLDTSGLANNIVISGTLTVSGSNTLAVSGNWSDSGTFTPSTGTVTFDGSSGNQTITKTGGEAFYNLVVNKSSGNLQLNNNVTLSGNSGDVLTLQSGGIDLNAMTMTTNGNGNYNIRATGAARTITGPSNSIFLIYNNSITNTVTITSTSSGILVIDTNVTLELLGLYNTHTQLDPGSSLTTIEGMLKISYGGNVVKNGPIYGNDSTLMYSYAYGTASAVYKVGTEWPAGSGDSNSRIPKNVQLNSDYPDYYSTTITMPNNSIRTLRGNMTFGKNTTLEFGSCTFAPVPPGYCGLDIYGNWYNNGGGPTASSRTVGFKGTSLQTIGGSSTTDFPTLRIENSSNVRLDHLTTVANRLYMATGNLDLAGFTLTLSQSATIYPSARTSFNATKMVVADNAALCKIFNGVYDPLLFLFPIGDDTGTAEFSPAELDLDDTGGDPYTVYSVCVRVINAKHPNLDKTSYFTRYWKITKSGDPESATFDSTFYYLDADVVAVSPITEKDFYSARFNTSTWEVYNSPVITTTNTFSVDSVTMLAEADYTPYPIHPTAVTMVDMKAIPEKGRVRLEWTTAQEIGVLGFSVYRSTTPYSSGRVQISDFIPGQAGIAVGADYEFLDTTAGVGVPYYYWIEATGSGGSEFFGPLEAILLNQIYLPILRR